MHGSQVCYVSVPKEEQRSECNVGATKLPHVQIAFTLLVHMY